MSTKRVFAAAFLLASALQVFAQQAATEALTSDHIVRMVQASVPESQIVALIRQAPASFTMTSRDLQYLIDNRVSDRVIAAMYAKAAGPGGGGAGGGGNTLPAFPAEKGEGVFYAKGIAWLPVIEERITWTQSGSVMTVRKVASVGTMKVPLHGNLVNESSKTLIPNPPVIDINVPGGDIQDYHLVELRKSKGQRRVSIGGTKKLDAAHNSVNFKIDAAAAGQYKISMPGGFAPGEYGIYSDRSLAKNRVAKIYTFEVQ